jgi:DNA-binding IclR family transcriptional regulator
VKAFQILQLFSPEEPVMTFAEIAAKLEYPKSTVHGLLRTLESLGYVEQVDNRSYALGKAVIPMTQAALVNVSIRDRSAPLLRQLSDATGHSVYLTVLDDVVTLYIYAVETSHRLLARSAVGDRVPLHCTAVGKALLAFLPEAEQNRIISAVGLPAFTNTTITQRDILKEELLRTVERGFSTDNQEHEKGSFCVGAPIFDAKGNVVASCSVAGDEPEVIAEEMHFYAGHVVQTAQEASRRMGFVPRRAEMIRRVTSGSANTGNDVGTDLPGTGASAEGC